MGMLEHVYEDVTVLTGSDHEPATPVLCTFIVSLAHGVIGIQAPLDACTAYQVDPEGVPLLIQGLEADGVSFAVRELSRIWAALKAREASTS